MQNGLEILHWHVQLRKRQDNITIDVHIRLEVSPGRAQVAPLGGWNLKYFQKIFLRHYGREQVLTLARSGKDDLSIKMT